MFLSVVGSFLFLYHHSSCILYISIYSRDRVKEKRSIWTFSSKEANVQNVVFMWYKKRRNEYCCLIWIDIVHA